jgi:hypothetical protein
LANLVRRIAQFGAFREARCASNTSIDFTAVEVIFCARFILFHFSFLEILMSFTNKLAAARAIVQGRAAERGLSASVGRYASVSAFNQNDEGIWRNGTGDGYQPDRDDVVANKLSQLFGPQFG